MQNWLTYITLTWFFTSGVWSKITCDNSSLVGTSSIVVDDVEAILLVSLLKSTKRFSSLSSGDIFASLRSSGVYLSAWWIFL